MRRLKRGAEHHQKEEREGFLKKNPGGLSAVFAEEQRREPVHGDDGPKGVRDWSQLGRNGG